jgi:hypothetical protein
MASEFLAIGTTGLTLTAHFFRLSDGQVWNGTTYAEPSSVNAATLAGYRTALTEVQDSAGNCVGYELAIPAGIVVPVHVAVYSAGGTTETWSGEYDPQIAQILEDTGTTLVTHLTAVQRQISNESHRGRWRSFVKSGSNPLAFPTSTGDNPCNPHVFRWTSGAYSYIALYTPYVDTPALYEQPFIARSTDGITWVETGVTNPIVPVGGAGSWNEIYTIDPDMVYSADHSKWFMVAAGNAVTPSEAMIGLWSSTDGLTWTAYSGSAVDGNTAPVIISANGTTGQAWEFYLGLSMLRCPTIFYESGTFYVYYCAYNVAPAAGDAMSIGLVTFTVNVSTGNVENFARNAVNPLIVLPEDEEYYPGGSHISICKSGSTYFMYISRARKHLTYASGATNRVACLLTATSLTGTWTYRGPVLDVGEPGEWDSAQIHLFSPVTLQTKIVELQGGAIKAYYSGRKDGAGVSMDIGIANGYAMATDVNITTDAILADTAELQTDWTNGGRLDLILDATLVAAAGSSGEGSYTGTLTVNNGSTGLEGVVVNARRGGVLKATGSTNASGQITDWVFGAYTYDLAVRLDGYQPETDTITVSASAWTKTISLTQLSITAPSAPGLCTVQFRVYQAGTAVAGAVCTAKLMGLNQASDGTILSNQEVSDTTDSLGVAELELVQVGSIVKGNGVYRISVEIDGKPVAGTKTTIPNQSTILFEDIL